MWKNIIRHAKSPVSMRKSESTGLLYLRIGKGKRCRMVKLSPREVRLVAYALLGRAEKREIEMSE